MKRSPVPFLVTVAVLLFFYLPIALLMISSFNASRFGGVWAGFSLRWYQQLFSEREVWSAVANSLLIATTAAIGATLLGSGAAYALYRYRTRLQQLHYSLIISPLVFPDLLMGMSLLLFFVALHMPLGLFTIFLAHTTFCISYVAMIILAQLERMDFSVIEAAQDLGANWSTIIWKVLFPLLKPGLASGALLAFTISLDDYIVTSFVAGPGSSTLPLYIYGMMKFGSTPLINALSTLILVVTFFTVTLTQYFFLEKKRH